MRWVGNYVARQAGDKSAVPDGLDALPELRSMFEWQIDASNAAVEAFAIIGMHVGLLYWIDKVWLANKVGTIFSIEPYKGGRNKECGWAAWNAFLVWVAPHVEYYKLLQSQYAYAVEQSAGLEVTERTMEQPAFRLGEHLMILYGRGHLPLDDDAALVRTFIKRANPKVRQRAFSFIGWSFRREEEIPQPILNRFMAIWDFYWTKVGQVDAQASDDDLFGRWFSSGHFPDAWSLDRLEQYVRFAKTFEADDELVKRLADIAAADISKALSILDALVHGDQQGWRIHSWGGSAASILKAALVPSVDVHDGAQASHRLSGSAWLFAVRRTAENTVKRAREPFVQRLELAHAARGVDEHRRALRSRTLIGDARSGAVKCRRHSSRDRLIDAILRSGHRNDAPIPEFAIAPSRLPFLGRTTVAFGSSVRERGPRPGRAEPGKARFRPARSNLRRRRGKVEPFALHNPRIMMAIAPGASAAVGSITLGVRRCLVQSLLVASTALRARARSWP